MTTTNTPAAQPTDGGPAFPHSHEEFEHGAIGMSLRDYFAAKALAGWIASLDSQDLPDEDQDEVWAEHALEVGKTCYRYADAMLAARESKR